MAIISELIIGSQLRPCIVKGKAALFHCWSDKSDVLAPSLMAGGHNGGVVRYTVGIIEYIDGGAVHECYPSEIRFTDTHAKISDMHIELGENDNHSRIIKEFKKEVYGDA
jgi:hypothetical protein